MREFAGRRLRAKSRELPLLGKTFVITGTLQTMTRDEAKARLQALGRQSCGKCLEENNGRYRWNRSRLEAPGCAVSERRNVVGGAAAIFIGRSVSAITHSGRAAVRARSDPATDREAAAAVRNRLLRICLGRKVRVRPGSYRRVQEARPTGQFFASLRNDRHLAERSEQDPQGDVRRQMDSEHGVEPGQHHSP